MNTKEKPAALQDEHLIFLDELRESGRTNMFGATPYLRREFPTLEGDEAREVLSYWMHTFGARHPKA